MIFIPVSVCECSVCTRTHSPIDWYFIYVDKWRMGCLRHCQLQHWIYVLAKPKKKRRRGESTATCDYFCPLFRTKVTQTHIKHIQHSTQSHTRCLLFQLRRTLHEMNSFYLPFAALYFALPFLRPRLLFIARNDTFLVRHILLKSQLIDVAEMKRQSKM